MTGVALVKLCSLREPLKSFIECHNIIMYAGVLFAVVVLSRSFSLAQKSNNVCPTFRDYFNMQNNSKCWYNFAAEDKVPDIIKKTGYPLIEYKVKTSDGYILKVFRIPNVGSKKPPIFMLHGVQGSSAIFVGLGKRSMAFLLYDAGYDVWLGNYRGSEYSEEHETLNATQREFWDYSADDIGLKDVPAMLQLVNYYAGHRGKIIYVGHSLGTTASLMYASEFPETAKKTLALIVMMSPAYKLTNMRSPYKLLLPFIYPALEITPAINLVQPISRGNLRNITKPLCLSSPPLMILCVNILNLFLGPFSRIAPETLPVYFNQIPAGTSLKTLTFLTEATQNRFRKYNYSPGKNMFLYGSEIPPEYDIKKITVPIYMMFASNDWATSRDDSLKLYRELPEAVRYGMYEIKNFNFNHYDFLYGQDSKRMVTDVLIRVLDKFTNEQIQT